MLCLHPLQFLELPYEERKIALLVGDCRLAIATVQQLEHMFLLPLILPLDIDKVELIHVLGDWQRRLSCYQYAIHCCRDKYDCADG
jgi:hypothetical protein